MDGCMQGFRVSGFTGPLFISSLALDKADHVTSIPMNLRYDIALLYLQQSNYNLDLAVETYLEDEKWEKEHPMVGSSKGKISPKPGRRKAGLRTGLTGQL